MTSRTPAPDAGPASSATGAPGVDGAAGHPTDRPSSPPDAPDPCPLTLRSYRGVYRGVQMTEADRTRDAAVDQQLIERWRAGDQRAATEIVERHATALARFALSLGVRDDLDELVQDTFVRAFSALDSFRADSSLRTWLFTIERRLVLDRRRAARRRPDIVEVMPEDAATDFHALDGMVADETAQQRAMRRSTRLSPMQRDVFTLRVQEGRAYKDIAEILGHHRRGGPGALSQRASRGEGVDS